MIQIPLTRIQTQRITNTKYKMTRFEYIREDKLNALKYLEEARQVSRVSGKLTPISLETAARKLYISNTNLRLWRKLKAQILVMPPAAVRVKREAKSFRALGKLILPPGEPTELEMLGANSLASEHFGSGYRFFLSFSMNELRQHGVIKFSDRHQVTRTHPAPFGSRQA